jgi:hypothetical protein
MDKRTLTALQGSIEKWKRVLAEEIVGDGYEDCPLCALFHPLSVDIGLSSPDACNGCPVKEKTGKSLCTGSPYEGYAEALDNEEDTGEMAEAELDFLRSLLPVEVTPA